MHAAGARHRAPRPHSCSPSSWSSASRSCSRRTRSSTGCRLSLGQDWSTTSLFALPLGVLAYTGLETVANLAEERASPARPCLRSLFSAIGLVVVAHRPRLGRRSRRPSRPPTTARRARRASGSTPPWSASSTAFAGRAPAGSSMCSASSSGSWRAILLEAATTSISGCTRLAHSMASHGMLPREFGRFERCSLSRARRSSDRASRSPS